MGVSCAVREAGRADGAPSLHDRGLLLERRPQIDGASVFDSHLLSLLVISRPQVDEAPVFTPTTEEFADPMAYIASIRADAQEFGACKIIPPAGWRSRAAGSCAVPDSMNFSPRLMPIHKLMQGVGFQSAAPTTLGAFRARADEFKAALCLRHGVKPDDEAALEALFWRIVQTEHEDLVVQYGADLDVDSHASGFGRDEAGAWNLRRLASHPDSLLRHLTSGVPGVSSPWLYVGMCYGAFCWHVEDLWMYSCNYMHEGAPKTWYTVPGAAAARFERAARALLPSLFARAPDLLFQLVAMLSPSDLKASGVPVYRVTQRPGEFVVTFPRAYHAGFSHGFNVAEAVNFAAPSWLPFGRNAVLCARRHGRTPPFSVDRLLCTLAAAACREATPPSAVLLLWLAPEVDAVMQEELALREAVRATGARLQLLVPGAEIAGAPSASPLDESLSCAECGCVLYLSGATARGAPVHCVCLRHLAALGCEPRELVGWQRFQDVGLRRLATCGAAPA